MVSPSTVGQYTIFVLTHDVLFYLIYVKCMLIYITFVPTQHTLKNVTVTLHDVLLCLTYVICMFIYILFVSTTIRKIYATLR